MRSAIALALVLAAAPAAFARVSHPVSSAAPTGAIRVFVVDLPAGELRIVNGPAGRIAASGQVHGDSEGDRAQAQRIVDDISVAITVEGDRAVIRPVYGAKAKSWEARNFSAFDLELQVPRGVALLVETRLGEVNIDGTFGDIDVDMRAGEVDLRTPRANVRQLAASCRVGEVTTNLGARTIKREGVFPGTTKWTNPGGGKSAVRVHVTAGEVDVVLTD